MPYDTHAQRGTLFGPGGRFSSSIDDLIESHRSFVVRYNERSWYFHVIHEDVDNNLPNLFVAREIDPSLDIRQKLSTTPGRDFILETGEVYLVGQAFHSGLLHSRKLTVQELIEDWNKYLPQPEVILLNAQMVKKTEPPTTQG